MSIHSPPEEEGKAFLYNVVKKMVFPNTMEIKLQYMPLIAIDNLNRFIIMVMTSFYVL